jgi:hypothetical protein
MTDQEKYIWMTYWAIHMNDINWKFLGDKNFQLISFICIIENFWETKSRRKFLEGLKTKV